MLSFEIAKNLPRICKMLYTVYLDIDMRIRDAEINSFVAVVDLG